MKTQRLQTKAWLLGLLMAWGTLGFSGCARAESPAPAQAPAQTEVASKPAEASPQAAAGETQARAATERKVIHKAELTLSSADVRDTADRVVEVVMGAAGYVAQRDEQHSEDHVVQSRLLLRVPAANFQRVLHELKERASVVQEHISGQDVTEEFSDVEARLRTLGTLEARLLTLTGSRDGVKDLLEVERELERVRSEIERLSGRRQWLENQTALASIDLTVLSPDQPAVAGTEGVLSQFVNAFNDGIEAAIAVTTGLIRVGFTLAPLVPLAAIAWLVYRITRRRRAAQIQA